jgi:hypothetical protein
LRIFTPLHGVVSIRIAGDQRTEPHLHLQLATVEEGRIVFTRRLDARAHHGGATAGDTISGAPIPALVIEVERVDSKWTAVEAKIELP